jgi:hypothetical protein
MLSYLIEFSQQPVKCGLRTSNLEIKHRKGKKLAPDHSEELRFKPTSVCVRENSFPPWVFGRRKSVLNF